MRFLRGLHNALIFSAAKGLYCCCIPTQSKEQADEYLGSIRQGQIQGVLPGSGAAAGRSRGAGRWTGLQEGRHRAFAAGYAADGLRPGGEVSGREEHLRAGRAAAAFRRASRPGPASRPAGAGPRPEAGHGLRPHRGAERPLAQGRARASALRHAGRRRLRGGGTAGLHGRAVDGSGAGVPPAVRAVYPAFLSAARAGDVGHPAGQPGQR